MFGGVVGGGDVTGSVLVVSSLRTRSMSATWTPEPVTEGLIRAPVSHDTLDNSGEVRKNVFLWDRQMVIERRATGVPFRKPPSVM